MAITESHSALGDISPFASWEILSGANSSPQPPLCYRPNLPLLATNHYPTISYQMAPHLTLLSFADLINDPPVGQRRSRKNVLDPLRWCQQHLDALRIHIAPHSQIEQKSVLFSSATAEEFAMKEHNFRVIRHLLCTLQRPVVANPDFFGVAWTISSFLSPNPWLSRGPTPVGYGNCHVLRAFVWLLNCLMGPRTTMSVQNVQEQFRPQYKILPSA